MADLLLSSLHSSVCLYFIFFLLLLLSIFSWAVYIFSPGRDRSIRGASAYRNDRHSIHVRRKRRKEEETGKNVKKRRPGERKKEKSR